MFQTIAIAAVWLGAFPAGVAVGAWRAHAKGRRAARAFAILGAAGLIFVALSIAGVLLRAASETVANYMTWAAIAAWWALSWSAGHLVPNVFRMPLTIICWAIGGAALLGYASVLYPIMWGCGVMARECVFP